MALFDSFRGIFRGSQKEYELKQTIFGNPDPVTTKETPQLARINPLLLEQLYMTDPEIFNTVNKIAQIIMSTKSPTGLPYTFKGDRRSVDFYEDFFDTIGMRGGEDTWRSLLFKTFQYQLIQGKCPHELIFDEKGREIVDLDIIDPKRFDYARNARQQIAIDKFGNPLGYVQRSLFWLTIKEQKFKAPEGITLYAGDMFIPPERVALFKLYETGDGFNPIGIVEPIYKISVEHQAANEGYANFMQRLGNPIVYSKVGHETYMPKPTENQLENAAKELKDINSRKSFAIPWWQDLGILESNSPKNPKANLEYYVDRKVTGMGMPKAIVTNSGEATNRSTLQRQEYIAKLTMKDIIEKTIECLEMKVMKRIAEEYNRRHKDARINLPRVVWGEIMLEEIDAKASRLAKYAQSGLLTPSPEIEKFIRQSEGLEIEEE